jgi:hypothetical protein
MYGVFLTGIFRLLALTALAAISAGCAGSRRIELVSETTADARGNGPTEIVVIGDWNDVEASVLAALQANEVAILSQSLGDREQTFELLEITDDIAHLTAKRDPDAGADMIKIRLSAHMDTFGNPAREEKLLRSVAHRLRELAGVEYRAISR